MKVDKKKMAISSLIIVLPVLFNIIFWDEIPTNGGMTWSGKICTCVFPYIVILVLHWLGMRLTFCDPKNQRQTRKAVNLIYWICPGITIIASCIMYISLFRLEFNLYMVMEALFGLMFVLIGNYLPKYRQNNTMGVKVKWTLQSEENWNKTHRFAGKLWTVGGALLMLSAFLPHEAGNMIFIPILLVLAVVPIFYSYVYYKKEIKKGTVFSKVEKSTREKKTEKVAWIFGAVILIVVGIFLFSGNIKVQYGEEKVTIEASYWTDMTIDYSDIKNIEYRQEIDPGSRTWGLGSFRLLAGSFQNDEFGYYTRYSYYKCKAGVVLETKEDTVVLSGKDKKDTKEIYEELQKRVEKNKP